MKPLLTDEDIDRIRSRRERREREYSEEMRKDVEAFRRILKSGYVPTQAPFWMTSLSYACAVLAGFAFGYALARYMP